MKAIVLSAAIVALSATAGLAQTNQTQGERRVDDLKGPPNANGYEKGESKTGAPDMAEPPASASNMKGSPNANGFKKK